jgi:heat shock protein HtpX
MLKTTFLMTLLTILMVLVGQYFGGNQGMIIMLVISLATNFYAYWNSDKMILAQYRAREVDEQTAPALWGIVKKLADKAGLPMPKVYIVDDQQPNAFATGRDPEHAAVCVTTALANVLNRQELEGVLGHEMTHVRNHDILTCTVAASMAGIITTISHIAMWFGGGRDRENSNPIVGLLLLFLAPIAASIIQLAVSRSREYKADEGGGYLCGNPDHLASALGKIQNYAMQRTLGNATPATANLFIIEPFCAKDLQSMFSTHPATEERIELLHKQTEAMRAKGELVED